MHSRLLNAGAPRGRARDPTRPRLFQHAALASLAVLSLLARGHATDAPTLALNTDNGMVAPASDHQGTVKWDQPPLPAQPSNVFYGWNEMSAYGSPQIAADDWFCSTADPVTRIRWWGSHLGWRYATPPTPAPIGFHFAIWTDVPANPGDPLSFSHPGTVIWTWSMIGVAPQWVGWDYDPITQTYESCFEYAVDIPQANWFYQNPGQNQILWLSIAAIYETGVSPPNPWGWKARPREPNSPAPDDAVVIWSPTAPQVGMAYQTGGNLWFPTPLDSWDLAFELFSQPPTQVFKWRQEPKFNPQSPRPDCYWGWDYRSTFGFANVAADDWVCLDGRPITGIHWWGSYRNWSQVTPPPNAPPDFDISIWTDVPAGLLPYSHPGQCIWQIRVPRPALGEIPVGCDYHPPDNSTAETTFLYKFDPGGPIFGQEPGAHIYWLCIAAVYPGTPPSNYWGWLTRLRDPGSMAPDAAIRMTSPLAYGPGALFGSGTPITSGEGWWDLAFELSTIGSGEPIVKWSQPPANWSPPDAFHGWNDPSVHEMPPYVADDWVCADSQPVTDVHWWGSFIDWGERAPPPDAPTAFMLTIWTDVPAGVDQPWSHPGQAVWQYLCTNFRWTFAGWDFDPRNPQTPPEACFLFECDIPPGQWFWQSGGNTIYWISIAAVYQGGPPLSHVFGVKTRPRVDSLAPDDAVRVIAPPAPALGAQFMFGEPIEYPAGTSWDLAFRLTSTETATEDFGDAPDPPYPTLLASNGARHTVGNLFLGPLVDPEADGQPNPNATGDDLAGLPDEDGVVFNTPIIPGQPAMITVTLGSPFIGALLSAWVDFNGDGSWATPGDQIFVAQPLLPGPNMLPIIVPPTATPNIVTFARFRLHTNPAGIPFTGGLPYGEVEDHQVIIGQAPEPKWSQPPHDGNQGFNAPSNLWWAGELTPNTKWIQRPDPSLSALHAHDSTSQRIVMANDWYCQGGLVTDLHWWGTVENPGGGQSGFRISIHASTPDPPCLPIEPALLLFTVPISQISVVDTGMVNIGGERIYRYEWVLPTPFEQIPGQRYWLDLSSVSLNPGLPYQWKWQRSSPAPVLCQSAQKTEPPTPGIWQPIALANVELAFQVTSVGVQPLNTIVADDFISDGRPIEKVRWWGSYFDARYEPGAAVDPLHVLDGWLISFHHQQPGAPCPPDFLAGDNPTVLGIYFAPPEAVRITPLGSADCNGHNVFGYAIDLNACCLVCSHVDPRTGNMPAQPAAFHETARLEYWLDIVAVTGIRWDPNAVGGCTATLTGHLPPENGLPFWGWHSSPGPTNANLCGGLREACTGRIVDFTPYPPNCWHYGNWVKQPWLCPMIPPLPVHMAFELITSQPPPNLAPWIVRDPTSLTVCEKDSATFEVWACGTAPLSYQWYKQVLPPPDQPVGGNSPQFTINPVQLADAGIYYVVVSNAFGSAQSAFASLSVWDRGSGDVNGDGLVNGVDIQFFVNVLVGGDTDPYRVCASDIDENGTVTNADVPLFVNKLLGL